MLDPEGKLFFIVMDLFSFHLRYLQVTIWIWKKRNSDESSTEQASVIAVFSGRGTTFALGRTTLKQPWSSKRH